MVDAKQELSAFVDRVTPRAFVTIVATDTHARMEMDQKQFQISVFGPMCRYSSGQRRRNPVGNNASAGNKGSSSPTIRFEMALATHMVMSDPNSYSRSTVRAVLKQDPSHPLV